MSTELKQLQDESRFLFLKDGSAVGFADYSMRGNAIYLTHTEITPTLRGQGLGDDMVQQVLDHIRTETELRVVAGCAFVADWLGRHPEYRELEERG